MQSNIISGTPFHPSTIKPVGTNSFVFWQISMKLLLVLPLLVAVVSGQGFGGGGFGGGFGGGLGGGFGGGLGGLGNNRVGGALQNVAGAVQNAVGNIAKAVPKVPLLSNVQDFGDFLVR